MIHINVLFDVKPEFADSFLEKTQWYSDACNAEPGCLFFKMYADPEDNTKFMLVESYLDGADVAHVQSDHFKRSCEEFPEYLASTPKIINFHMEGKTSWDMMAEYKVEN